MKKYPKRLIPDKRYVSFTEDEIKKGKLGRWHDPTDMRTPGSIFNDDDSVNASVLDYKRFPGLSCNLIPPSKCKDLKISVSEELLEEYALGTDPPKIRKKDFEIISHREVMEIDTKGILEEELPYKFEKDNHICKIKIKHKPLKGNFSHCEFDLLPSHIKKGQEVKFRNQKGWRKNLILALRRAFENHGKKCN
ncbi:MAG: hypothetical protein JXR20_02825 [Balneola sp.]